MEGLRRGPENFLKDILNLLETTTMDTKEWEADLAPDDELDDGTELYGIDFDYIL